MHELRTSPRQRRSQESITAILDAAEGLIHERSAVNFTSNELATAADMSVGRVYYWFPDIPAVVQALTERMSNRLIDLFRELVADLRSAPMPRFIDSAINALCDYVDDNPAFTAVCLATGETQYGAPLVEGMISVVAGVLRDRVPDITDAEVHLVSNTTVGITLGMLHGYTVSPYSALVRTELIFVLAAYLNSRYAPADHPVWTDPLLIIRPSRRPGPRFEGAYEPVWPALAPGMLAATPRSEVER